MLQSTAVLLDHEIQEVADEALRLALQQRQAGLPEAAAQLYRAILSMQPRHAEANYQLGMLEMELQSLPSAVNCFAAALKTCPQQEHYWLAYIDSLIRSGEQSAAHEALELGRRHGLSGKEADALANRLSSSQDATTPTQDEIDAIMALVREGHGSKAYDAALSLTVRFPRHGFGWKMVGFVHQQQGQLEQALHAMQTASACSPDDAEAFSNLGFLLNELGRLEEAESNLLQAVKLKPDYAEAYNNLGISLQRQGRIPQAEAILQRAIALNPDYAVAYSNLGITFLQQNRLEEAVEAYRNAIRLQPDNFDAHSNLLFCLSRTDGIDARALFKEHLNYAQQVETPLRPFKRKHINTRNPDRRLRVGFVSGDLRQHAVALFIEPVLKRLSEHGNVSLHAYYNYKTHDKVSERLRSYMMQWRDIFGCSDDAVADMIQADSIDILIDLAGHTAYNRLPVFARKPAPVQVTWIGYPGTTGLESMDYYLTDRYLLPPGRYDDQFIEKLVYLPVSAPFQPVADAPEVGPLPARSNGRITFGSFNHLSKLSRGVVSAWARLLRAIPDARLILAAMPEDGNIEPIASWLTEENISLDRISFYPRTSFHAYLDLHNEVDICLDTFPYSGASTTLHALWMGVPTLTLAGDTAAGRQTSCILEHFELPQFIAPRAEKFVEQGILVCADLDALSRLRSELRGRLKQPSSNYLNDITDSVERAMRMMWQRWCKGLANESFEVPLPDALTSGTASAMSATIPTLPPVYVTQPAMPPLEEFIPSLEKIWNDKWLTNNGPFHQQLEQALCEYLGVEHISLFANGTLALMTAVQALGIKGEVITTPYSFVATSHALLWNGINPVFVDIDPVTLNLDPDKIEAAITPHTAAIMPVHCYGAPCDVEKIERIARKHGLKVIYDAAHAFGVQHGGKSLLNNGDLSVLSFHATKVFNTFEGGAIVCRDAAMKIRIDQLKNFGITDEVTVVAAGINGKMHEVSAAFGLLQLKSIDQSMQRRHQVDQHYRYGLAGITGIKCMPDRGQGASNYGYFPILVGSDYPLSRDQLYQKLRDAGIYARRYFYPLISEFPMYRSLPSAAPEGLPVAARISREVLCLPIFPGLTSDQIDCIINLIRP